MIDSIISLATFSLLKKTSSKDAHLLKVEDLPPKTGRKYIIVGGTGFIGNWIVATLIRRGEDPKRIRVVDLLSPKLPEQLQYVGAGVEYVKADITDLDSTISAFTKAWLGFPSKEGSASPTGLTVFHCAAVLRYFERHSTFLPRSVLVNMSGTRNVIEASKAAGADILLYTSSSVVGIRRARLFSFPWESKRNTRCTQVVSDEGEAEGKGGMIWRYRDHHDFTSNYAETKYRAELLIRNANKSNNGELRTGILRPGSLIYGPTPLDPAFLEFLKRPSSPLWTRNTISNLLYIENCICAHLLYEQRLLEAQRGGKDLSGHAYLVADSPFNFVDITMAMTVLTEGKVTFFNMSPTFMYLLSHLVEGYELLWQKFPGIRKILPKLGGDVLKLQPSTHQTMMVNVLLDDSLIRASVEKEGLGFKPKVETLDAVCHTVKWLVANAVDKVD
ncbi:hypothetical protein NP233_g8562 [Leucocoprinus birnbaumii]|uniref:3-beta hydroxysteroid dehydrogenase/isomerase domain-containing protein n=1 Tax=Leucocoprinus birnbaumii TaxID=56174 RepID=A0AAD5YTR2_9AGAR|nr:hypothetical protein NP233_g8562 [Leucocoprinus birnbaumii]